MAMFHCGASVLRLLRAAGYTGPGSVAIPRGWRGLSRTSLLMEGDRAWSPTQAEPQRYVRVANGGRVADHPLVIRPTGRPRRVGPDDRLVTPPYGWVWTRSAPTGLTQQGQIIYDPEDGWCPVAPYVPVWRNLIAERTPAVPDDELPEHQFADLSRLKVPPLLPPTAAPLSEEVFQSQRGPVSIPAGWGRAQSGRIQPGDKLLAMSTFDAHYAWGPPLPSQDGMVIRDASPYCVIRPLRWVGISSDRLRAMVAPAVGCPWRYFPLPAGWGPITGGLTHATDRVLLVSAGNAAAGTPTWMFSDAVAGVPVADYFCVIRHQDAPVAESSIPAPSPPVRPPLVLPQPEVFAMLPRQRRRRPLDLTEPRDPAVLAEASPVVEPPSDNIQISRQELDELSLWLRSLLSRVEQLLAR